MKGSKSTCLLCRHLLATSGRLRNPRWQEKGTRFSSTAALRNDDTPTAATAATNETPPGVSTVRQPESMNIRRVLAPGLREKEKEKNENERRKTFKTKWSQKPRRKTPAKDTARMDALFEQIIHEQTTPKDASASTAPTDASRDLALVQAIEKLERMVERDEPVADAYNHLKIEIYPMLQEQGITIPRVYYTVVSRLMDKVFAAKKDAIRSPNLPTVADIFRVYVDIGEMRPKRWAILVGELVQSIVDMGAPTGEQEQEQEQEHTTILQDHIIRHDMLADLVESWKVLSLPKIVPVTPENEVTDGFWFPGVHKASLKKFSDKGNFPAALSSLFSDYPPNQLGAPVAVLAIATYALLLDPQRSKADVRQRATRFVAKIAYLITFVNFRDAALKRETRDHFPKLESYIMGQWPIIKEQLKHRIESMTTSAAHGQLTEPSSSTRPGAINSHAIGDRLRRAYLSTRNTGLVDQFWQKFVGSGNDISPEKAAELQKHPDLFDSFINIRMAQNQPDKAIEALNTLRKVGLKPTIKTWNGMLDGCKKAGNVNAIKNVWTKLAGSGMKLDTRIWTTRVSGLIESGDVNGGIQAVEEMTKLWNKSSKDENATAVKPTIEPINAALVGLINQDQVAAAESLLAWAGRQGIEPDVFTFNTLLRRFVRDGRNADVRRLFLIMEKTGVRADEATFTAILDGAFSKIAPDDAEQQAQTVANVFHQMQAAGLEANLHTYGKLVYELLRSGDHAHQAVKVVLAHLWDRNLELSPHIYTMLVEHYFSRAPPDLDAVETLLLRRRLLDNHDMDATFYDRLVKGYSLVGQTGKALDMYYKLSDKGLVIILSTQMELLRALLRQGQREQAKGLVANTKRMFEESHHKAKDEGEVAGFWGHPFWRVAFRAGIFEWGDSAAPTATKDASVKT
ncbi:hypothetical protein F4819DRAFT_464455 [Hypoxylon fuscum]|nr:hypothetical protein F4819DRAFT_464455 [Hypoxylon fuscum]